MILGDPKTQTQSPPKQPLVHGEEPIVAPPPPKIPREPEPTAPEPELPIKDETIAPGR